MKDDYENQIDKEMGHARDNMHSVLLGHFQF